VKIHLLITINSNRVIFPGILITIIQDRDHGSLEPPITIQEYPNAETDYVKVSMDGCGRSAER